MDVEEAIRIVDTAVVAKVNRHLKDIEVAILQGSWQGQKYHEIAESYSYTAEYLLQDAGPKLWKLLSEALEEKVSKTNFRAALERRYRLTLSSSEVSLLKTSAPDSEAANRLNFTKQIAAPHPLQKNHQRCDWGEAIDVSTFYGRTQELTQLEQWLTQDSCRVVALLGMGGMGKTALSVRLTEQIQGQFDCIIWRSLRNAPPIQVLLVDLLKFLSNQQETNLSETLEHQVSHLVQYLRQYRCLLVLDNVETILCSGDSVGGYLQGYEGYGELLRRVGEERHQSCLVLASREKPKEIALLEGEKLLVRSFQLTGLNALEGQEIFRAKGFFTGSECDWKKLIAHYVGNPLALKIVASAIHELFDGKIAEFLLFLTQNTVIFDDIRDLLERQFDRLSNVEQEVMYWLAIDRELVSLSDLQHDTLLPIAQQELLKALSALRRRSLIEKQSTHFTQQPVVMEYIIDRLTKQIDQEVTTGNIVLLNSHALLKAQAKDYIRETQSRLIIEPIIYKLLASSGCRTNIVNQLLQMVAIARETIPLQPGYLGGNVLNLLRGLKTNLRGYDFSYLTIRQAYLQGVELHRVNFAYSDFAKSVFTEAFSTNLSVAFSPNGELLATGNADGNIRIWQVTDGKKLFTYKGHISWVWCVTFSPDGHLLVSSGLDQTVRIWEISTGECLKTLHGHSSWVWTVAFSPDGHAIASGSADKTIRLWDIKTGECFNILYGHSQGVWAVPFSPDGQMIASGSDDKTIRLWDVNTGQCLNILEGHTNWIFSVVFSPVGHVVPSECRGALIASSSADQTIRLWDVQTGACLKTLCGHTKSIISVAFSPDGQTLASGSVDQTVRVWDVQTGNCLKTLHGHTGRVWSVAFSPASQTIPSEGHGAIIASGSEDQTVKLWDVNTGQSLRTMQGQSNCIRAVAFSPDGQTLVSGSDDKAVRVWDVATGQCLKTLLGHTNWLWSVTFSPDSQTLVSGSCDQTMRLWDAVTGRCLKVLQGHTHWVTSVAVSPNKPILVSGSTDQTLKIWDTTTEQCLKTLRDHTDRIYAISLSSDGQMLASASADQTVKLWDVGTGVCLKTLQDHTNLVLTVAFSPDGQVLASGSEDQTIKLWDIHTGVCLNTLQGHSNGVWSVAFSPDGQVLASGSDDQTIKLWDVRTGECLNTLQGHCDGVWSVAFAPQPELTSRFANFSTSSRYLLASGSQDGTIRLWDGTTGYCLALLRSDRPYEFMNIEGVTGLTEAQKDTLKALGAVELEAPCLES